MDVDDEGWWSRQVAYGDAIYSARCPECARFVRCDDKIATHGESAVLREPNATCSRHGRVMTPFLCWATDGTT